MDLCQGDDVVLGCWVMATHDGFIFFDVGSTASHAEQHGAPRDPVCNCLHNKDPREQALKFTHLHQIPQICFQAQAGGVWPRPLISCLTHTYTYTHTHTHTHTHMDTFSPLWALYVIYTSKHHLPKDKARMAGTASTSKCPHIPEYCLFLSSFLTPRFSLSNYVNRLSPR